LLTLKHALGANRQFHYTALETDPLGAEMIQQLNYPKVVTMADGELYFQKLHAAPWDQEENISENFKLLKRRIKLEDVIVEASQFDLVYFDAFAPSRQPELWTISILAKVERAMRSGAVFVTYCAKGQFKRDLKSLGFLVESLPGPPGKLEMVRAMKS
jgi:tRNA U34 5-methylaminomethyl-2-thiouridine-forming methyltransferase MnmC